jgi:hypothetical protein
LKRSNSSSHIAALGNSIETSSSTLRPSSNRSPRQNAHHSRSVSENFVIPMTMTSSEPQNETKAEKPENLNIRTSLMIADDAGHLKCKKCKSSCESCTCVSQETL